MFFTFNLNVASRCFCSSTKTKFTDIKHHYIYRFDQFACEFVKSTVEIQIFKDMLVMVISGDSAHLDSLSKRSSLWLTFKRAVQKRIIKPIIPAGFSVNSIECYPNPNAPKKDDQIDLLLIINKSKDLTFVLSITDFSWFCIYNFHKYVKIHKVVL